LKTFSDKQWSNLTLLPAVVLSILLLFLLRGEAWADKRADAAAEVQPYIGMQLPHAADPRVPILEEEPFLGLHMNGARTPVLKRTLSGLRREVKIDSTGKNINFVEKLDQVDFRLPTFLSLSDYVQMRRMHNQSSLWVRSALAKLGESSAGGSGGALRIDIPVEIKNRTFQAIFGGGTVGLDVTGEINIKGGLRNEKRSEVSTSLANGSHTSFTMEQTQRFQVQGHVGEKVTIGVDQDSERAFDFENNLHLSYKGNEDEIVQSIEAGNIALSLPGTRFVTFGGQSSGLFGLKAAMNFGRLQLTAIASQEKGENKKLSLAGGASQNKQTIEDYNYIKNQYFFLDEHYRNYYPQRSSDGLFLYDPNRNITDVEVYTSQPNFQNQPDKAIRGWAWSVAGKDTNIQVIRTRSDTVSSKAMYLGYFIRLEKTNYDFNPELGYIRLHSPLSTGEVLAVAYRDSSGYVRGMIDFDSKKDRVIQLRMLRSENPMPSDVTWNLEWKHVYSLGTSNIPEDGFNLKIYYKPPSGDPQETIEINGAAKSYLQIFGLDRVDKVGNLKPDNVVDKNDNVLRLASGELWFPELRPFDPLNRATELPDDKRTRAIYDTTVQSYITAQSKFYIEVESQTRSAEYRLGMNIIENSEEVTLNGRKLNRGTDYTIDYFTGTLRMLNEEATRPTANVDVTYESNQMFQIDKKTIMGARAEYALWDDSFIGGTFLYLNERTLEQKVRVGKGPMRNMVWDVNTSMTMKPFFMTRLANHLPFVDTRQPSTLRFEGEVAQVIPNPNTINNESTDDNDGVAYIDDFEAAKSMTPLGISRRSWSLSSVPQSCLEYRPGTSAVDLTYRGDLQWWEPYGQYPIQEIWPNRDVTSSTASTTSILQIKFTPPDSVPDKAKAWGGIQKSLSAGYWDQTESKYLEIWVHGDSGTLHIDLGSISEDIIPNNELNTEDRMRNMIRNNVLDDDEDVGIDGMADNDPRAIAAGGDYWDINGNGQRDKGEPYSNDNWRYTERSDDYSEINGMEGNANDYGGRIPDTEDMNRNGGLDRRNDYFEYSVNLDPNGPDKAYLVSTNEGKYYQTKWKLYRIPLRGATDITREVGNPSITEISYVRIWFDGFHGPGAVWIADINLVGNEWKELGVADAARPEQYVLPADSTKGVFATVLNTHEDPDYIAPPGVRGEIDKITQAQQREQALVMTVKNLQFGENGVLQKTFYEAQDYINYRTLKMFVGGNDVRQRHIREDSSQIEFFLRFGADLNNYYEISEKVYDGWDPRNNIEVDLVELSAIKLIAENYDSTGDRTGYQKITAEGKTLFIKGSPALRNVRMLVVGVRNLSDEPFNGELWLNELRLSNVKKDKGMAYRVRLDFDWADLLRFNGEVNKQDADFHNISTRYGDGDNSLAGNFQASINLDKFLPRKLGLSIPVSYNYGRNEATPKYKPGTDVEVTTALPDSILEQIRTMNEKKGFTVSFGINSRSNHFIVKNILSGLRANYSQSEAKGSSSTMKHTSNLSQSGNLDWGVTFGSNNYFRPFKFLGQSPLLLRFSEMKLFYTPTNFNAKISGTRTLSEQLTRTKLFTDNNTYSFNSSLSSQVKLFESLSLDLSRSHINDLQDIPSDSLRMMLNQGRLGILTNMTQNVSLRYNPKIFSWLTTNGSYSSNFRYGFNRQQRLRDVSMGKTYNLSGSFDLAGLFKSLYRPGGGVGRPGPSQRPRPGGSAGQQGKPQPARGRPRDAAGAERPSAPSAGAAGQEKEGADAKEQAKREKLLREQEQKVAERITRARMALAKAVSKDSKADSTALKQALADSVLFKTQGVFKTDEELKRDQQQKEQEAKDKLIREKREKEQQARAAKERAEQLKKEKQARGKEWLKREKQVLERLSRLRKELLEKRDKGVPVDSTDFRAAQADSVQLMAMEIKSPERIQLEKELQSRLDRAREQIAKAAKKGVVVDSTALKKALADSLALKTTGKMKLAAQYKLEEKAAGRLAELRRDMDRQIKKKGSADSSAYKLALADSILLQSWGIKTPEQFKMDKESAERLSEARRKISMRNRDIALTEKRLRQAIADSIQRQTKGLVPPDQIKQEKRILARLAAARKELAKQIEKGGAVDSTKYRAAVKDSLLWAGKELKTPERIQQERKLTELLSKLRAELAARAARGAKLDSAKLKAALDDSAYLAVTGRVKTSAQIKKEKKIRERLLAIRKNLEKRRNKNQRVDLTELQTVMGDSVQLQATGRVKSLEQIRREQKLVVKLVGLRENLDKLFEQVAADSAQLNRAISDSTTLAKTGTLPNSKVSAKAALEKQAKAGQGKKTQPDQPFTVMGMVGKLFEVFEPMSINYGKRDNMAEYGLSRMPGWRYQLGLSDSTGVPFQSGASSSVNRNSNSVNNNLSLSSGFGLSRDIKIQFKFNDTYSLNSSTTTTGQRSQSRLVYEDLDMPFPEWSIRISSLEKLPLLNRFVQRVSLDHNYNGQFAQTFNVEKNKEVVTRDDRDSKFAPLVGFSLSFKNGMTVSLRYNSSSMVSLTKSSGEGATRTEKSDFSLTANYAKKSDFRIPIPIWPFKNMQLKNNMDLAITMSIGSDVTMKRLGEGNYEVTNETSKWFFKPNLNYSFSDRVRGGAYIELGNNHHKLLGDTSYKEFGISASISIRGG